MKVTIEIDAADIIELLEDRVANPTGGKETEETLKDYIDQYLDEIRDVVEEYILEKLVQYHTH